MENFIFCAMCEIEFPCLLLKSHFVGCSPVNLLHIFKAPFTKNTSGWLLLKSVPAISNWISLKNTWIFKKNTRWIQF